MKRKNWDKMMMGPMKKALSKLYKKLGLHRDADHIKLQQDVRSCEYEDVHVLWEMLKRNEVDLCGSDSTKNGSFWEFIQWAKHTPLICRCG